MIQELKTLVENTNTRVLAQVLGKKSNKILMDWVITESAILDQYEPTIKERVWYILLNKPTIVCKMGNKQTFNSKKQTYGFCDNINKCECLKKHQIDNYVPRDMNHVIESRKKTWLKKYGVENAGMAEIVKQKRKTTMAARNYSHIYNNLSYKKETIGFEQVISRVSKVAEPLFDRTEYNGSRRHNAYPWRCISCLISFESHVDYGTIPKCPVCYPKTVSQAERDLANFIRALDIDIITNTKKIISPLEIDIYIPDKKIAIEYNGIHWHSSEKKSPDYHVTKYLKCKEKGIHLIQIFEDEWLRNPDIIKNRLKNILGMSDRVWARKGIISELTTDEYKKFTENNHLRGYAHATIKYGIFIDNKLVAAMGFSKSRYTKEGVELIRYCSDGTVIGGAGKLLSYFKKIHDPKSIVTYADRCWSNGDLYRKLGFTDVTTNQKNFGYWYIKNLIRYHRSSFTKGRLVKLGHPKDLSEYEIMSSLGYTKIHDCGNYKFIWNKS